MSRLLERITSPAIRERLDARCRERPEVQTLLYIMWYPTILEWVHSVGVCTDARLAALVPPFPPLQLRNIVAAPEIMSFLWTGVRDLAQVIELYEEHRSAHDPTRPAILDFGCGCGRMTRFLNDYPDQWEVHASDVNRPAVEWCRRNLRGVQTVANGVDPPLPFADGRFNLVYTASIFTHLPEPRATAWLAELRRVLAPSGILIVTTHGIPALEIMKGSKEHQELFRMDDAAVGDLLARLPAEPYVFLRYAEVGLRLAQAGEEYGNAFIHPDYVRQRWASAQLELVQHLPGGARGWQDVIVFRRRS